MRGPLSVAVCQPPTVVEDRVANAYAHAAAIVAAQARLVVFPEMSLTGYQLGTEPVRFGGEPLRIIATACAANGAVALVGAPVHGGAGRCHIGTWLVSGDRARVVHRKRWLGAAEAPHYAPGDDLSVIEIDEWQVALGICKETGVDAHVDGIARRAVHLYVASVLHHDYERPVQDERGQSIARRIAAPVAFASFAGCAGGGYDRSAGGSAIWDAQGAVLAGVDHEVGGIARTVLAPKTGDPPDRRTNASQVR